MRNVFGHGRFWAAAFLGTRPNISESHSEIRTRVPFCIAGCRVQNTAGDWSEVKAHFGVLQSLRAVQQEDGAAQLAAAAPRSTLPLPPAQCSSP